MQKRKRTHETQQARRQGTEGQEREGKTQKNKHKKELLTARSAADGGRIIRVASPACLCVCMCVCRREFGDRISVDDRRRSLRSRVSLLQVAWQAHLDRFWVDLRKSNRRPLELCACVCVFVCVCVCVCL
uniref:Uncharacterized protein n=1 Tax=Cyanoptyche gloeocystis TaxID=77922 RepID=A0A7S2JMR2_9EUKA